MCQHMFGCRGVCTAFRWFSPPVVGDHTSCFRCHGVSRPAIGGSKTSFVCFEHFIRFTRNPVLRWWPAQCWDDTFHGSVHPETRAFRSSVGLRPQQVRKSTAAANRRRMEAIQDRSDGKTPRDLKLNMFEHRIRINSNHINKSCMIHRIISKVSFRNWMMGPVC